MHKLFAVRDVKADAFGGVMSCPTSGIAARMFVELLKQNGPIRAYPEDYSLYEIGSFNPSSGRVEGLAVPELIMTALEAVATARKESVDPRQTVIPGTEALTPEVVS